ncbi:gamma-glutamylcyclotransferase family protein [Patescibacteria group bacterium]
MKYFAYGTNMDDSRLVYRCPSAKRISSGSLVKYRFMFNSRGVATIVKDHDNVVYGLLFEIDKSDIINLDRHEGFPVLYKKKEVAVSLDHKEPVKAMVYIAVEKTPGKPRSEHWKIIYNCLKTSGFPEEYVRNIQNTYGH